MSVPKFREDFGKWLMDRLTQLQQVQQQLATVTKGTPEEKQIDMVRREVYFQLESTWKESTVKGIMSNLGAEWAVPELREHITYFMGLAKMELAIRAEMRWRRNPKTPWPAGIPTPAEQYASAAEWFRRYEALIIPMDTSIWADAVKERMQECTRKSEELLALTAQAR